MATWLEAVTEFGRLTCLVARFGAVTDSEHFAASLFIEGIRGGEQNDIPEVQTALVLSSAVIDLSPTARGSPAIGRITSPPRGRAAGAGRRGTLQHVHQTAKDSGGYACLKTPHTRTPPRSILREATAAPPHLLRGRRAATA
ncbi:hypothetical protein QA802_34350 [Streptomyces sp. B21-105]|uniref:hypothetical protein n=1 Tax=Streptomyces sp. B21-105 TaxID=3039417 RepID=UPI002FEEBDA0